MKSLQTVCLLFVTAGILAAQQYTISTVAGIPNVAGLYPRPGDVTPTAATIAQLYHPSTVAVDSKGNYYIADYYTYTVRMVTVTSSSSNISTIAGTGFPGSSGDNDLATSANFFDIHGIAVDSSGNVYVSDTSTCRVRKIDNPTGTKPKISTFSGNTTGPFCGPTANTTFGAPGALAFDSKGTLYVADYANSIVYSVSSSGKPTPFVGTGAYGNSGDGGAASKAAIAYPVSLTFDSAGNLYIGDEGNSNIRKVDTAGNISTVATGVNPLGLGVDASGNFYYVDGVSSSVRKVLPGGGVVTIAGNGYAAFGGDNGPGSLSQVSRPGGLAVAPDGTIYVADTGNNIIRKLVAVPNSIGIQDAASQLPGSYLQAGSIAPGEVVTLFGTGLGPATLTSFTLTGGLFPTQIAGTSVKINSIPAPMIYTSSGLVSVIAPYAISGSTATIELTYQGKTYTTTARIASTVPAIFTSNASGTGQAAALNQNLALNSVSNPAKAGSVITLYATGAGYTTKPVDGRPAPTDCGISCLGVPQLPVNVKIGSQCVVPLYAGDAPSLVAGVMQINARIPASILPGSVPVQVVVGSANCDLLSSYPSQDGVTIAVTQ